MTRKTITIPHTMDRWIKAQIKSGRYRNDSEYVRDLIRRDREAQGQLSALRAAIQAGRESGVSDRSVDELIVEAQAEQPPS